MRLLTLAASLALMSSPVVAQQATQTHSEGSAIRSQMIEATRGAIRAEFNRRIRFNPVRVATNGNWGFIHAEPSNGEELCYDAAADSRSGAPNLYALLYRFDDTWHVVRVNNRTCYRDANDFAFLAAWKEVLCPADLVGSSDPLGECSVSPAGL